MPRESKFDAVKLRTSSPKEIRPQIRMLSGQEADAEILSGAS
jgi:hypothetical protein